MDDNSTTLIRHRGEGERLGTGTNEMIIKLSGKDTGGAFSLFEYTLRPAGITPPPHRHAFAEVFYVQEGALAVSLDGQTTEAEAGATVYVPGGAVHTFDVAGEAAARFLVLVMPAGIEHYFLDLKEALAELPPGPPDMAILGPKMAQLSERYGVEPVSGGN